MRLSYVSDGLGTVIQALLDNIMSVSTLEYGDLTIKVTQDEVSIDLLHLGALILNKPETDVDTGELYYKVKALGVFEIIESEEYMTLSEIPDVLNSLVKKLNFIDKHKETYLDFLRNVSGLSE